MRFLLNIVNHIPFLLAQSIYEEQFWQEGNPGYSFQFMKDLIIGIDKALLPFMFTLATVFTIYSIVLGVNYAKAENQADSKKKLVGAISSVVIIIALTIVFKFILLPNLGNIFNFINDTF